MKSIQDVDTTKTADFTIDVPVGWSTIAGAGKHLVTDFGYDAFGRIVQTLGPKNTAVDDSNQAIEVRPASWAVYDEINHEMRSASGYATLDANGAVTGYVLSNPVAIVKRDASGNVLEQIHAARSNTAGKLLPTDTFPQSSYVSWTKNLYNNAGQVTATRRYFAIPASGEGTKGEHYDETTFRYDNMGRQSHVTSPDGTIT